MSTNITISEIKNKLEKLDYSRFERDFQGKEHKVQRAYWNCVLSDILFHRSTSDYKTYYQQFTVRFHESFLGCFYKAHELHQYLLTRFDGLHKVYRFEEPYNSAWNNWKNNLDKEQAEHLQTILYSSKEQKDYSGFIKVNLTTENFDLQQFDNYQEYLSQKVYNMFTLHLEHSEFRKLSRPPTDIVLPYEINPIFISRLQDHSKSFLKARTKKYLLNRIDTLFRSNGNFIKAYKTAEPKEAVLALLKQFPEYRHLTSSQISHIVRLYYKNKDGETLKLNSIRSVLKTLENSE